MEEQDRMTYYFITDNRKLSRDDMLRIERVAAIEAKQMGWKLFVRYDVPKFAEAEKHGWSVSLN